jgi:hypothetical protein
VLGQTFSLELAAAVAGDDLDGSDDWQALDEFLAPSGAQDLRFTHALLRDVAYEGLPFRRRRDLHGRAGAAIVQRAGRHVDDQAELLSLHFFHAQRYESRVALLAARRGERADEMGERRRRPTSTGARCSHPATCRSSTRRTSRTPRRRSATSTSGSASSGRPPARTRGPGA